jgi:hypothetical protein
MEKKKRILRLPEMEPRSFSSWSVAVTNILRNVFIFFVSESLNPVLHNIHSAEITDFYFKCLISVTFLWLWLFKGRYKEVSGRN